MEAPVVVGLVHKGSRVLMVRRRVREGQLRWNFPGGSVEPGETSAEAIQREVFEETTVLCIPKRRLGARKHPDTLAEITYWSCRWLDGEPRVRESKKVDRVRWIEASEAPMLVTSNLAKSVRKELRRIAAKSSSGSSIDTYDAGTDAGT